MGGGGCQLLILFSRNIGMEPLVYDSTLHGSCAHGPETLETSNPSHGQSLSLSLSLSIYIYIHHIMVYYIIVSCYIILGMACSASFAFERHTSDNASLFNLGG